MNKSIWLARLLYRHPDGLTKADILEAWRDEDDRRRPMAESTFYDNRGYLASRFGLHIDCRRGRYFLAIDTADGEALLRRLVGEHPLGSEGEAPGDQWVEPLAEAIAQSRRVLMGYAPLDKAPYTTDFCPYLLRQIRGRGYVVGMSRRHAAVRTYALDRIRSLQLRTTSFRRPAGFDAEGWFADSFGAYGGPGLPVAHVVIAPLTPHIAAYLRQRPLHASQREEGGPTFHLDVALTPDFVGQMLSMGCDIHILAPDTLRQQVGRVARAVVNACETPL
jgi:predicted DNA-binding transcriptional regulator YafY